MSRWHRKVIASAALVLALACRGDAQTLPGSLLVDTLGLQPAQAAALQQALDARDYIKAESILLPEIEAAHEAAYKDRLLQFVGGVYFLNHDDLHAAVAWKKAESIAPLPAPLQFSLAMAYIRMGHRDWARTELKALAAADAANALYPYWLGRIDYDAHAYEDAIAEFQKAIQLDPGMARAYNNLGLCYFYRNENTIAVANFEKSIALDPGVAWPHINLAAALQVLGHLPEAEASLRDAIRLDPAIASAHFELGNVLDNKGDSQAAVSEYSKAAQLDAHYAEPHFALARMYRKLGKAELAQQEVQIYLRLHHASQESQQ